MIQVHNNLFNFFCLHVLTRGEEVIRISGPQPIKLSLKDYKYTTMHACARLSQ
jgi:hypothetical protein